MIVIQSEHEVSQSMQLHARVLNIDICVSDHHTRNRIFSLKYPMVVPAQRTLTILRVTLWNDQGEPSPNAPPDKELGWRGVVTAGSA
jgi:hypothetical protein